MPTARHGTALHFLLLSSTALLPGCDGTPAAAPKLVSLTLTPPSATVEVGEDVTFQLRARDRNGDTFELTTVRWRSSDALVATVPGTGSSVAVVHGIAVGSTTISAEAEGLTATAALTVVPPPVASVTVSPADTSIASGTTATLTATARSADGTVLDPTFSWSSSEPSVAGVSDNGDGTATVAGAATGSATVTATADGVQGSATVGVTAGSVAFINIDTPTTTLVAGESTTLTAHPVDVHGNAVQDVGVSWTSSDETVASLQPASSEAVAAAAVDGTSVAVTGAMEGQAIIEVTAGSILVGLTITVTPGEAAGVTVTPAEPSVVVGSQVQLQAEVRNAWGAVIANPSVAWVSADPTIASVSESGVVTANTVGGPVQVTATSGGASGSAQVRVVDVPVASVYLSPKDKTISVGESFNLEAEAGDRDGNVLTGRTFEWRQEIGGDLNPGAITLDGDPSGPVQRVTGREVGRAVVWVEVEGKEDFAEITVLDTRLPMGWAHVPATRGFLYSGTNLARGTVGMLKTSPTGRYSVTFGDLAAVGDHFTVHVTTDFGDASLEDLADPPAHCFPVADPRFVGEDVAVDVGCYRPVPSDFQERSSDFRVTVIGEDVLGGGGTSDRRAFFSMNPNHREATYGSPPGAYSWTSSGQTMTLTPVPSTGRVEHHHRAGLRVPFSYYVNQRGGSQNDACELSLGTSDYGAVLCRHPDLGDLVIEHFLLGFEKGRPGQNWGYALVQATGETHGDHTAGIPVEPLAVRAAEGKYRVWFWDGGPDPAILLSPALNPEWRQCAHQLSMTRPVTVEVACWDEEGQWADTQFNVAILY